MKKKRRVLLIGGSGNLGSTIRKLDYFKNLDSPSEDDMNLHDRPSITKYLKNDYQLIINCAAKARMKECEENPSEAIKTNIFGTMNLVKEIMNYTKKTKKKIKIIHISTDCVYPSTKGNYSENDPLKPYNVYCWTKLCSESIIRLLENHIVIRTNFFNKEKIRFDTAATDVFTSKFEIQNLVKEIKNLSLTDFIGIVNVGKERDSDFNNIKKFMPTLKPCKREDINKNLSLEFVKDSSMNLSLLKKIKIKYKKIYDRDFD